MQFKSISLLLVLAVALVVAQDSAPSPARERARLLAANRRTKLIEESQQQRASAPSIVPRRRLVSKSRVGASRTAVTEAAVLTTTTTTPAPTTAAPPPATEPAVFATEPTFPEFTEAPVVVQQEPEVVEVSAPVQQEEPVPVFRPRPPVRFEIPELDVVQQEPVEEVQPVRQRPLAGPARTRPQQTQTQTVRQQEAAPRPVVSRPAATRPAPRPATSLVQEDEELVDRKPFVETTRRYNFIGEDGSFTFGYENADGSFKEETRGVDCVVRGKYGYIDPEGVRREFTYQTGNPCDPNAVQEEVPLEEEPVAPVRRPVSRPNIPERRPNVPERRPNIPERRPIVAPTLAQIQNDEATLAEEEREIAQVLDTPTRISRPPVQPAPQPARRPVEAPRPVPASRPVNFDEEVQRFSSPQQAEEQEKLSFQPPPFQSRPPPQRIPVTERPERVERPIFNDEEDPFPVRRPAPQPQPQLEEQFAQRPATGLRSFTTELVFDPRNNQFQTAIQQRIPATNEEVNVREQLIAFAPTTTTPSPVPEFVPRAPVQQQPRPVQQQRVEQPREQPNQAFLQAFEELQGPVQAQRRPVEQPEPVPQQRPVFNPFQARIEEQERIRQDGERRRQQEEQQRLSDERQRIAEENERRRITPAVQFIQPGQVPPQQRFQPFPPQFQGPQQFAPQQQPQFFGPPQPQPGRSISEAERPSFASGQIDSFLSGL